MKEEDVRAAELFWHGGRRPLSRLIRLAAESIYDLNERKLTCKKPVEYIQDESFVIPLAPNPELYVMLSRVRGFSSDGEASMS
jgi:hypothetical protein